MRYHDEPVTTYFFELMSSDAEGRGWRLDGSCSKDSGDGVNEPEEPILPEERRSLTQPLELPLGFMGLGGSSMRRIISGVNFRIVSLFTTFASTTTTGLPVMKAFERLSQDLARFSAG